MSACDLLGVGAEYARVVGSEYTRYMSLSLSLKLSFWFYFILLDIFFSQLFLAKVKMLIDPIEI